MFTFCCEKMEQILVEDLIYYRVLPYSVYDEEGRLLFELGTTVTPELISTLRKTEKIFKKNTNVKPNSATTTIVESNKDNTEDIRQLFNNKTIVEKVDFIRHFAPQHHSLIDDVDINNYTGPLNKHSKFDFSLQIKMKTVFVNAMDLFIAGADQKSFQLLSEIRNKINTEIELLADEFNKFSELLFFGEYNYSHMLNTAMMANIFALKLGYSKNDVADITSAALLHDIGRFRSQGYNNVEDHTIIGYKLIKDKFKLSETIALAVLGHHENNDGSGYPQKLSGDQINVMSNIINICSTYDNLVFNRTPIKIYNNHDALRELLKIGTKSFLPEIFYTFIHMFSYNDITPLEDMIFE